MNRESQHFDDVQKFGWWWVTNPDYQLSDAELFAKYGTERPFYGQRWTGALKDVAWNYELVRRLKQAAGLPPFPQIDYWEYQLVCSLWMPQDKRAFRFAASEKESAQKCWTSPDARLQWNLDLPVSKLTEAFGAYIRAVKQSREIEEPKKNQGNRHRPLSWRWLELLDLATRDKPRLSRDDRSKLTQARRKAEKESVRFAESLRSLREKPEGELDLLLRFAEQSHFPKPFANINLDLLLA